MVSALLSVWQLGRMLRGLQKCHAIQQIEALVVLNKQVSEKVLAPLL